MGKSAVREIRRARPVPAQQGFTLLEVVISVTFLTITSLVLLQSFCLTLRWYASARARSDQTIRMWNQSQQICSQMDSTGSGVTTVPPGRPLYESSVGDSSGRLEWKVLHAQR